MRFWPKATPADRPAPAPVTYAARPVPSWPALPAIQRAVPAIDPVADRVGFERTLSAYQNPSFLAPLAHLIDPDGPSGRISGLVEPAPPRAPAQSPKSAGVVQRWPQRWLGGPVISRLVEPELVSRDDPSDEPFPVADVPPSPAVAVQQTAVQQTAAATVIPAVQRSVTAPDPVELATATPAGSESHLPRARMTAIGADTPASVTEPVLPPRQLAVRSDAPTVAPAVQRSLVSAPEPEPVFRTFPVVSRAAESVDAVPDAVHEVDAAPEANAEASTAAPNARPEPADVTPLAGQRIELAPPPPVQRVIEDGPVPRSTSPVPRAQHAAPRVETDPSVGVQRSGAAPITGGSDPQTPQPAPRRLGLGAPIERRPVTAALLETVSLQQWAAARDAGAPATSSASIARDATVEPAHPVTERRERAPIPTPDGTVEPPVQRSESAEVAPAATVQDRPPLVATDVPPTAETAPESAPTETVTLLGDRPGLLAGAVREAGAADTGGQPDGARPDVGRVAAPGPVSPAPPVSAALPAAPPQLQREVTHGVAAFAAPITPTRPERTVRPVQVPTTPTAPTQLQRAVTSEIAGLPSRAAPAQLQRDVTHDQAAVHPSSAPPLVQVQRAVAPPVVADVRQPTGQRVSVFEMSPPGAQATSGGQSPLLQRLVAELPEQPLRLLSAPERSTVTEPTAAASRAATVPGTTLPPAPGAVTPTVQRFAVPPAAPPATLHIAPAADAGSIAVAAGIAHRTADGSVAFDVPHPAEPAAPVAQRAVDVDDLRADAESPAPTADTAAPNSPSTTPAATAAAGGAAAPAGPAGTANLDDLARRLYDPLAARLKAELRLDRERFGLVTDLRRP